MPAPGAEPIFAPDLEPLGRALADLPWSCATLPERDNDAIVSGAALQEEVDGKANAPAATGAMVGDSPMANGRSQPDGKHSMLGACNVSGR